MTLNIRLICELVSPLHQWNAIAIVNLTKPPNCIMFLHFPIVDFTLAATDEGLQRSSVRYWWHPRDRSTAPFHSTKYCSIFRLIVVVQFLDSKFLIGPSLDGGVTFGKHFLSKALLATSLVNSQFCSSWQFSSRQDHPSLLWKFLSRIMANRAYTTGKS